jgi:hypothetical protein
MQLRLSRSVVAITPPAVIKDLPLSLAGCRVEEAYNASARRPAFFIRRSSCRMSEGVNSAKTWRMSSTTSDSAKPTACKRYSPCADQIG